MSHPSFNPEVHGRGQAQMGRGMPQMQMQMGRGMPQMQMQMGRGMPQQQMMGRGAPQQMGGMPQQMGRGMPQQQMMGREMPQQQMMGRGVPQQQMMGRGMPQQQMMGRGMPQMQMQPGMQMQMQPGMMGQGMPQQMHMQQARMGMQPGMVQQPGMQMGMQPGGMQMQMGGMMGMQGQMPMGFVDPLQQFFQQVDTDNSGAIDPAELKQCLLAIPERIEIDDATATQLVKMFRTGGYRRGGTVNALNFLEFKQCYTYLTQIKTFFQQLDQDRSGSLDVRELTQALQMSGYRLDHASVQNLLRRFSRSKTNMRQNAVSLGQYFELCVLLATVAKLFKGHQVKRPGARRQKKKKHHRASVQNVNWSEKAQLNFRELLDVITTFKFGQ